MLTLGLAGGLDAVDEQVLNSPENYAYDGAAVLVEDGVVIAGAEEARLNRIKHSDKFPFEAIRFCLEERGLSAAELDGIGYYVEEAAANTLLARFREAVPGALGGLDARQLLAGTLGKGLGAEIDPARLYFCRHRLAHAAGAVGQSGFDDCLVYVVDTAGGILLGSSDGDGRIELDEVATIAPADSLNTLAERVLPLLGLGIFDEPKAMALAALGDPTAFAPNFARLCELLPDGAYALHLEEVEALTAHLPSRRPQDPFTDLHADLAAALQLCMERIALHVLRHYRALTGKTRLCLAGGMIENSALSGRILTSWLFDEVFVHPAAHDAGCAIGAALLAASDRGGRACARLDDMYWGAQVGSDESIAAELEGWEGFLEFERSADVAEAIAARIAAGEVVGWAQGRAEFGVRALGNRAVLADPRSPDSIERVGRALHWKGAHRPLSAAVLEEDAEALLDLPGPSEAFAFPVFSIPIRDGARVTLPATTQVDGTAQILTVSRQVNRRFWDLLAAFKRLTGVPALASTSFNNDYEPTVDSTRDAVVSFLTTGLDHLVIGDFVATKLAPDRSDWLRLRVSLPPYARLRRGSPDEIGTTFDPPVRRQVSPVLADLLGGLDQDEEIGALFEGMPRSEEGVVLAEVVDLWTRRLLVLRAAVPADRSLA
jgi:carbamoyltransferase